MRTPSDERRCTHIKRDGERCRQARCKGETVCCRHGGGPAAKASKQAWRHWRSIRAELYRAGFDDEVTGLLPVTARPALAEAWLSARAHGDPAAYLSVRRALMQRSRSRIAAAGRGDLLDAMGIERPNHIPPEGVYANKGKS